MTPLDVISFQCLWRHYHDSPCMILG